MREQTRSREMRPLSLDEMPGLSEYLGRWWSSEEIPRPAGSPLHLRAPEARAGPAWRDADFMDSLLDFHRRLGAPRGSLQSLQALADGAPCVITGQQPAIFGGPLYCAWKLASAVGLAERLGRRWSRRVVPVYWCGADDSDFEEARRIWVHGGEAGPWRAALSRGLVEPGGMVGDVPGEALRTLERSLIELLGERLDPRLREELSFLDASLDLGEQVAASLLRLFADTGLVVVDARSRQLRKLARPLVTRYIPAARVIAAAVDDQGAALERAGFSRPLHPSATQSGLFALRNGRRTKLEPGHLDADQLATAELAGSVLLRPLIQDELLAPVAAVLGPAELHYHAQLAPAYRILGVDPAAPAPRAHLCLLPEAIELPDGAEARRGLLAGGESAREFLAECALPNEWRVSMDQLAGGLTRAIESWKGSMGEAADPDDLTFLERSWKSSLYELRRRLLPKAIQRDPRHRRLAETLPELMAVRGTPQERAYASWMGWQWLGNGYPELLGELSARFAEELLQGRPTLYCVSFRVEAS